MDNFEEGPPGNLFGFSRGAYAPSARLAALPYVFG